jgi:hypothetical protein
MPGRFRLLSVLAGALVVSACVGVAYAAFGATSTNPGAAFSAKRIFPADRSLSPRDLRDASNGSEANKSDADSFADAIIDTSATAIASGTNRYIEYTMNSGRPTGLPVSSAQFNYRLASKGGSGSGNACFWFDVRSGGNVIGTHGSYAAAAGCSTGTTQTTVSTALPEVTTTDQVNGLVIRAYVWETGTTVKQVNVDMATVTGSTPYAPSFTMYEHQIVDDTSGTPATTVWSLSSVDATAYTAASNWPSAAPVSTKYLKLTFDPSVASGSVINSATLTNVWRASGNVTNGGTVCYYFETFNGSTSLATHGSGASAVNCDNITTNVSDVVSLPEVDTATKASNLVIKLYYWMSPLCGGSGNPGCVKSVTDQAQVTLNYHLD